MVLKACQQPDGILAEMNSTLQVNGEVPRASEDYHQQIKAKKVYFL